MGKINRPLCATQFGNTGFGDCFLDPGKFIGAIQVPKSFQIAESDISNLQAVLEAATSAGVGARIYPYTNFTTLTDGTEDVTVNTSDYGSKTVTRNGYYDWTFRYNSGGVLLHQQIGKNAGPAKYFLFYDENDVLYGTKAGGVLKGIPVDQFIVPPWRLNTGAETALYTMRFLINPVYLNLGNLGYISIGDSFNLYDIQGLESVDISLQSLVGTSVRVSLQTSVSGVDLSGAYSTNLARTTAWVATRLKDGTNISIVNVVYNSATAQWYIYLNPATFATLADGEQIQIALASPAVLSASPILVSGFDGIPLVVVIPAS